MRWLPHQRVVRATLLLTAFIIYSVNFFINTDSISFSILVQYVYATSENEEQGGENGNGEGGDNGNGDGAENNSNNLEEIIEKSFVEKNASINNTLTLVGYTLTRDETLDDPILETHGEIRNDGAVAQEFVKINATFYDEEDEIVGTDYAYADTEVLEVSKVAPFDLSVGFEDDVPVDDIDYIKFYLDSQEADESVGDDSDGDVGQENDTSTSEPEQFEGDNGNSIDDNN